MIATHHDPGDDDDHDPLRGDHRVVDPEEADVDRQHAVVEEQEVLEARRRG